MNCWRHVHFLANNHWFSGKTGTSCYLWDLGRTTSRALRILVCESKGRMSPPWGNWVAPILWASSVCDHSCWSRDGSGHAGAWHSNLLQGVERRDKYLWWGGKRPFWSELKQSRDGIWWSKALVFKGWEKAAFIVEMGQFKSNEKEPYCPCMRENGEAWMDMGVLLVPCGYYLLGE